MFVHKQWLIRVTQRRVSCNSMHVVQPNSVNNLMYLLY